MRLTDLLSGLLAKAARVSFGKHTGMDLFGGNDFEQRKEHLHQESRVDRRGRVTQRWVSNEKKGVGKKKGKPAPPALGLPTARGNMPALFAEPVAVPKKARPKRDKPAPEAPLFGFDFGAPAAASSPVTVRTKAGDLNIRRDEQGRLTVEGLSSDSHLTRREDGDWHLHVGPGAQPIHLRDDGQGALSVVQPEAAPAPAPLTPQGTTQTLHAAIHAAQADPTPEHEQALRAAIKNSRLATDGADENTSHVAAPAGDTPAPAGQRYLVGLPDGVKDGQRKRWNEAAEQLVLELQAHPRPTTLEERQLLARYSGNGGIGASLNEYYTPPELGEAMWQVMRKLGSGTGAGLEPSSGPGVLAQFAGEDARMDLVELSPISAGIANALFGHRHDVHSMSFEAFHQRHPEQRYDFLTGNPPFGPRDENAYLDDGYQDVQECSRYFTLRALDHLKEGGVATLVLPAGLARNQNDAEWRARVLARAEVVAIHGLPTDTFSRAGTDTATTDVWVLRARPEAIRPILDEAGEVGLKAAGAYDEDFIAGRWHVAHPDQMHGTVTRRPGPRGAPVYARDGDLSPEVLARLVQATPKRPPTPHPSAEELVERLKGNPRAIAGWLKKQRGKEGETRLTATGQLQLCMNGRWHNVGEDTPAALKAASQLSDLIGLHATVLSHGNYAEANALRESVERLLTEFRQRYGNPHENAELLRVAKDSPAINNLLAAFQPDGQLAPVYREDTRPQQIAVDPADPASVLAHLRRSGQKATLEAYRGVTGHATPDEAADHLIAHGYAFHPERGTWSAPGEFYSGDSNDVADLIARGLSASQPEWARRALEAQREELRRRVPTVPLSEFEVTPRDSWVPKIALIRYLGSHTSGPLSALIPSELESWLTPKPGGTYEVYAPHYDKRKAKGMNFLKRYLTGVGARSDEAGEYADLDEGFRDWLAAQPDMREAVEEAYAARGTWLEPTWNTDPVDAQIAGWRGKAEGGVTLHTYQNEAIHRSLAQGGGIIALDVGLGKTPTAIAQCYYARQQGLARKPVAAVPKSVIGQWRQKALQVKPDARVLVVGAAPRLDRDGNVQRDEQGREVWDDVTGAAALDRQLSQMKTGDYDLVLMTHTTLGRIQYDPMQQLQLIQDEFYSQTEDTYGKPSGMSAKLYQQYAGLKAQAMLESGEVSLADLEAAQARLKELDLELKERYNSKRNLSQSEKKDKAKKKEERQRLLFLATASRALAKEDAHPLKTQWDELGIDHLIIDEAHEFKALWTYSKSRGDKTIKYLGAPNEPSQRAVDLYYKCKAMRDAQGGRGVYLLTATPIKNSPVELYGSVRLSSGRLVYRAC
ncbi:DEAD-like helicase (plasmid) [Deinococcus geothermalis DSM 11300]|uniref:DEAD-like helicase n=1 Tax=Deinococcus geothermalis (strain DSM 11300 / CIP 105573 / AG-3a) TaxID=319795 RepID=A8ZRK7_DEIGD|nr:N-6 DNA methylase [Deinococcus geothermalis]ABW35116.1 DEAD-like helicase [Deinococcus geothermalis DSM 11300]